MKHIVLVEDDQRLANLVKKFLEQNNFKVSVIDRGDKVIDFVLEHSPDLLILDIMLPHLDGFSICRKIRQKFTNPILFLTAKDSDFDHVLGLEMGADDYIIKPIEPHVLLARINTLFRRASGQSLVNSPTLSFGKLSINKNSRIVTYDNNPVDLTSHEFELLWLLASKAGEVQSRDFIHQKMIGREYDGLDRSVDVRISRLRKKLFDNTETPYRIITIWGKGYLFSATAWD
ncbi:MAG: response regulator [Alteromonadaceae bacterium]|nr:response regulator [Alteromonadaceae bacterium]